SIESIRCPVKWIKKLGTRIEKFNKCARSARCESTKSLVFDCPARWNSTYNMLEVAHEYKDAFARYDLEEVDFRLRIMNKGHLVSRSEDWVKAKRLCHFLKTFYDITLRISGTKYVTSHTLVNELATIRALLRAQLDCDIHGVAPINKHLYDIATAMKAKFEKYYGEVENLNLLVYFAFILDPRNKYDFLDVIVDDHYGREGISIMEKKDYIKGKMKLLYEDYVRIHAPSSTSSSTLGKRPRSTKTSHEIDHGDMLRRRMKTGQSSSSSTSDLDKDLLAIPISTVASESVFSTSGRVLDSFRSSLGDKTNERLVCAQDWHHISLNPEKKCRYGYDSKIEKELMEQESGRLYKYNESIYTASTMVLLVNLQFTFMSVLRENFFCTSHGCKVFGVLDSLITGSWLPEHIWYAAADKAISIIYAIYPLPDIQPIIIPYFPKLKGPCTNDLRANVTLKNIGNAENESSQNHDEPVIVLEEGMLNFKGIPLRAWSKTTFNKIARKWGELVFMDDSNGANKYSLRICVKTKFFHLIAESLKVIIKGKVYVVRAKEVTGWVPDFGEENSGESEDYSDNNSVGKKNWVESEEGEIIPESVQNDAFIDNIAEFEPINGDSRENQSAHEMNDSNPKFPPGFTPQHSNHYEYEKVEALRESTTPQDSKKNYPSKGSFGITCWRPLIVGMVRSLLWDILMRGYSFTWSDKHASKMSKLDRKVIQDSLIEIDLRLDKGNGLPDDLAKRANLFRDLKDIDHNDSIDLAQKAKIKWAVEGDENSNFFHGIVNKKRRHLAIKDILVDGEWIDNSNRVKSELYSYYSNLFSAPAWDRSLFDVNFPRRLNSDQVFDLEDMVFNEEIKRAVWDCGFDKSSGPDGFTFEFFKKFWTIVGRDVTNAIKEFFISSSFPKGCNSSFIALIPKVMDAKHLKDFRPISLIGCQYKIIGKILANRLSLVIDDIVSQEQSAFIKGRQKMKGPLIPNEVISWLIDRGMFDPIFLGKENRVPISHLFYANDAMFIGKWSRSNANVLMMMLHCFSLASGLKVNVHKSNNYGVGVRQADVQHMAKDFGCIRNNLPFTYLGVKFDANMMRLNSRSDLVKKVSNKLSNWKAKTLSVRGRLTLLKSVLEAILTYYMSLFKAPEVIGNENTTRFWHDIWYDDICFKEKFKRLFNLELQKDANVASKLQASNVAFSFRQPPRSGIKNSQFIELGQILSSISLSSISDRWSWTLHGLGDFSVKSAREEIDKHVLVISLSQNRWSKVLPIKLNVFSWRMMLDRLPTRSNLHNRGINITCILCPNYGAAIENRNHLFSLARCLWI
nr:zinc finger BED domain-containing protein RICESLEEPER 2 [Tanacetum cinerariifolium]